MPAAAKLTELTIQKTQPPATGQREIWDAAVPGFGLRVAAGGAKSFVFLYRAQGRSRRLTLGRWPALGLAEARGLAREAQRTVALGGDPAAEKSNARHQDALLFRTVAAEFVERHAKPKNRSWRETQRLLEREVLTHWGQRPLESVTKADVVRLLDGIVDRGAPVVACRTLAAVRKLCNWAVERGLLTTSPCLGLRSPARVEARDRVLSEGEVARVWAACARLGWPFGPLFRLLLLTGQRREEVASMRWRDLDLDAATWTLPREATKSDRRHVVPLSPQALRILRAMPRVESAAGYVFPAKRSASAAPVSGFSAAKRRVDAIAGVGGWRLHDLRRTLASGLARLGTRLEVIERVLNHSSGSFAGVAGVYNRFAYLPEMRAALDAWGRHLEFLAGAPDL